MPWTTTKNPARAGLKVIFVYNLVIQNTRGTSDLGDFNTFAYQKQYYRFIILIMYNTKQAMNFKVYLSRHKKIFDKELDRFFQEKKKEFRQVDKVLYDLTVKVQKQALRGGKRLRPLLCLLAYDLAGGKDKKKIIKAGIALELIHQFLITHDDIIDRDEKRYGKASMWRDYQNTFEKKYKKKDIHLGNSMAMIAGDHMNILARAALNESSFDNKTLNKANNWFNTLLFDTFAGWQIQYFLNFEDIDKVDEKIFLKGMRLVSGRYTFEGPLVLGLILAGNKKPEKALRIYSENVGIAYQITDDILGMFGKSKDTGKPVGNDFREGKKSLLVLRAYKKANNEDKKFLKKLLGKQFTQRKFKRILKIIIDTGSLKYSLQLAKEHVEKGKKAISSLKQSNQGVVEILHHLADFAVERKR